jgi:hypothetical protein
MNGRLVAALMAWPLLAVVVVGVVANEAVLEPGLPVAKATVGFTPAIETVRFHKDSRLANFGLWGLEDARLERALDEAKRLEQRREELIAGLATLDPDEIQRYLCIGGRLVYDASAVVLTGTGASLAVEAPSARAPWSAWQGFDHTQVANLMRHRESRSVRQPEDTAMGLMALLSGHLPDALEGGTPPWNVRVDEGGKLATLEDLEPRAAAMLPVYAATVHVLAEIVQGDVKRWQCARGPQG